MARHLRFGRGCACESAFRQRVQDREEISFLRDGREDVLLLFTARLRVSMAAASCLASSQRVKGAIALLMSNDDAKSPCSMGM